MFPLAEETSELSDKNDCYNDFDKTCHEAGNRFKYFTYHIYVVKLSRSILFFSSVSRKLKRERGREGERECLSLAWQSLHILLLLYCDCVIYSAISTYIARMRNSLSIPLRSDKRSA